MIEARIDRNDGIIQVFTAALKGQADKIELYNANSFVRDLANQKDTKSLQAIAQITRYVVEDALQTIPDWTDLVADKRTFGAGETMVFEQELGAVEAFIQSKGATTPRSKVISKRFTVESTTVSARPYIHIGELESGRVDISRLAQKALTAMENEKNRYILQVLMGSFRNFAEPEYGYGADGVSAPVLDAQIQAYSRLGTVNLVGDIHTVGQLTKLAGFQASATEKVFADYMLEEQHIRGYLGSYNGAQVTKIQNAFMYGDWNELAFDKHVMFLIPTGIATEQRPFKVGVGPSYYMDAQNINDLSYEMRFDQEFGAAVVRGNMSYIGVHEDKST